MTGLIYTWSRACARRVDDRRGAAAGPVAAQVKKRCGCRPAAADKFVKDVERATRRGVAARRWRRWPTSRSRRRGGDGGVLTRGHGRASGRNWPAAALSIRRHMSLENPNPPLVSPFPPIADYGFLSDCETCALVAPSGAIEWMCLPRFDGPSVFGALLDRDAGTFRLGPADTMVPAARRYLPGTMILETSWGTEPRLADRPRRAAGRPVARHRRALDARTAARPRTTTPTTCCCGPCAASTARSRSRWSATRSSTTAAATPTWEYVGEGYSEAVATAEGWPTKLTLTTDLRVGFEGSRVRARHDAARRRHGLRRARLLRPPGPEDLRRGLRPPGQDRRLLAPVARARHVPGPSVAPVPAALRADAEGPDLLAHRRDDRRRDDLAARDARAASATGTTATRWVRDSTFMLWGLHSLGFEWEANDYFYFMQDAAQADDLQVMYGIQGERELIEETLDHLSRLRQRPPRADRQRRLQPAPARRVGHDAGLDLPARQVPRPPARAPLAADRAARRGRDRELARSPTAASGRCAASDKHFVSSKVMCWVACDRGARLARLREAHEHADALAARTPTRSRPTSSSTAARTASSRSTTRPTRWTPARC